MNFLAKRFTAENSKVAALLTHSGFILFFTFSQDGNLKSLPFPPFWIWAPRDDDVLHTATHGSLMVYTTCIHLPPSVATTRQDQLYDFTGALAKSIDLLLMSLSTPFLANSQSRRPLWEPPNYLRPLFLPIHLVHGRQLSPPLNQSNWLQSRTIDQ